MTDGGMRVVAVTHKGKHRDQNEDRVAVGPWILAPDREDVTTITLHETPFVVAVLDGMGGQASGAVAATIAAEVVASEGGRVVDDASAAALAASANRRVYSRMEQLPVLAGMGTTLAGVGLVSSEAVVFNVGDSRVYVEADGYLVQLSIDDASPTGALTQSLGGLMAYQPVDAHVLVEGSEARRFLLATDGLFGHVEDQMLEACLIADDDEGTVRRLLATALDLGGPDNVSIVLVRFGPDSQP